MSDFKYPDDFSKYPDCWKAFYEIMAAGQKRAILYGPPGTGKTHAALNIGEVDRGSFRLICTETMTEFDIAGGWMPNGEQWEWYEGQAVKAWRGDGMKGARLVIDEIDKANGDPLGVLLAFTDSPDSARWKHPQNGRIEMPKDGFSVIATTNVEDLRELPPALLDRFPVSIRINEPHPLALETLPKDLRHQAKVTADAGDGQNISLRKWQSFAEMRETLDAERAAKILFKDQAQAIVDALAIQKVEG